MASKKSDFDVITKGFISYLEKTGQLSKLPHLAKESINASKTLFDPNLAIVQTVIPLDPKSIGQIEAKLKTVLNRPIKVIAKINKDILGGMLIRIGDQIIDLTLKSRIKNIKHQLASWKNPPFPKSLNK